MTDVGLEPTHPKIVELESTPLDHSGNLSNPKVLSTGIEPVTTASLAQRSTTELREHRIIILYYIILYFLSILYFLFFKYYYIF